MPENERRRFQRVVLHQPLRGAIGDARVYLVEASMGGIRVVHQTPLPAPGGFCRVEVVSQFGPMKLDCEVVRTAPQNSLFQSGLLIIAADRQSVERLKTLFGSNPDTELRIGN